MNIKFYKVPIVDTLLDIDYSELRQVLNMSAGEAYVALEREDEEAPRGSWVEITTEEFRAIEDSIPKPIIVPEPTNAEIKQNQLIVMDAIATLFETMMGGVS